MLSFVRTNVIMSNRPACAPFSCHVSMSATKRPLIYYHRQYIVGFKVTPPQEEEEALALPKDPNSAPI